MTQPHFGCTADYNAIVRELKKVQSENTKLITQLSKTGAAADKALGRMEGGGKKANKQFGMMSAAGKQIVGLVSGFASVQGAVQLIGDAMRYVQEETNKAVEGMKSMVDSDKRLAQIATSTDDLAAMESQADKLAAKYGESRQEVRQALFSMRSTEVEIALDTVIKYGDVVGIQAQAGVAGMAGRQGLFAGQIDPTELLSAGLVAAGSSVADFETLLSKALPRVAEGGALAGFKPEEMLGIMGVMAGQFESPDVAGSRFRGLFSAMGREGLTGMKGLETLADMSPDEASDVIGDAAEVRAALNAYKSKRGDVKERIAQVSGERATYQAGGQTALDKAYQQKYDISLATTDEARKMVQKNIGLEALRKADIGRELGAEEAFGQKGLSQKAARAEMATALLAQGQSGLTLWGAERAMGAAETAGMRGNDIRTMGVLGGTNVFSVLTGIRDILSDEPKAGSSADAAATIAGQRQR